MHSVRAFTSNVREGTDTQSTASFDGYPYAGLGVHGQRQFPNFTQPADWETPQMHAHPGKRCKLQLEKCFKTFTSANEVFQHVAFAEPACGDCSA